MKISEQHEVKYSQEKRRKLLQEEETMEKPTDTCRWCTTYTEIREEGEEANGKKD